MNAAGYQAVLDTEQGEWDHHKRCWSSCQRCHIANFTHAKSFFRGYLPCEILFVGEAPGKTEAAVGLPFMGMSGKLLDEWIKQGVPESMPWAVTNVLACRPTSGLGMVNRKPELSEMSSCHERLQSFIWHLARPKAIVTLGKVASEVITPRTDVPFLRLLHPSFVQRFSDPVEHAEANRKQVALLSNFIKDHVH